MVEIGITRISSKGQIVIPLNMRGNFNVGDNLILFGDSNRIILKKANKMDKQFHEDLEFARRTEEAYKRIESGEGVKMDFDNFINEIKKW